MRDPKGKKVTDLFPQLFEDDDDEPPVSEDDVKELQNLMNEINGKSTEVT